MPGPTPRSPWDQNHGHTERPSAQPDMLVPGWAEIKADFEANLRKIWKSNIWIIGVGALASAVAAFATREVGFGLAPLTITAAITLVRYARAKRTVVNMIGTQVANALGYDHDPAALHFPVDPFDKLVGHYTGVLKEDGLRGTYNGVTLHAADVRLTKQSGTGKNRRVKTIFEGIMVAIDMPEHLDLDVEVLIGADRSIFNGLVGVFSSLDRVKLEDPEFERVFEVMGSDQILARRFLTPSMMERIMALKARWRGMFLHHKYGKLYLTLPTANGLFEMDINDGQISDDLPQQFAADVRMIESLVDALNLDRATRV